MRILKIILLIIIGLFCLETHAMAKVEVVTNEKNMSCSGPVEVSCPSGYDWVLGGGMKVTGTNYCSGQHFQDVHWLIARPKKNSSGNWKKYQCYNTKYGNHAVCYIICGREVD